MLLFKPSAATLIVTILPIFLFVSESAANCAHGTSAFPRDAPGPPAYGYNDVTGPLNWFVLNKTVPPANLPCATGRFQSPIVIDDYAIRSGYVTILHPQNNTMFPTINIQSYPNGAEFVNLGTTVEVEAAGSLTIPATRKTYQLAQYHFHVPSEHRFYDRIYSLEMHAVFEDPADKAKAVVAFAIELCQSAPCGEKVLVNSLQNVAQIPVYPNRTHTADLNFQDLMKKFHNAAVWKYTGSLTTPPCTQGVDFYISHELLFLDLATWLKVKDVVKFNARYTQNRLGDINLLQNAQKELNGIPTRPRGNEKENLQHGLYDPFKDLK